MKIGPIESKSCRNARRRNAGNQAAPAAGPARAQRAGGAVAGGLGAGWRRRRPHLRRRQGRAHRAGHPRRQVQGQRRGHRRQADRQRRGTARPQARADRGRPRHDDTARRAAGRMARPPNSNPRCCRGAAAQRPRRGPARPATPPRVDRAAAELHRALAAAVDHFSRAARSGGVPPALRQRLALASGQVAAQREALARATASLDRAIDVLMPRPGSGASVLRKRRHRARRRAGRQPAGLNGPGCTRSSP